jgi:sporulation protein YtfJ
MPEHPIETLIKTSMESIREMVDVNTILGDPVETPVPVSRVSFGFAAGGSEFSADGGKEQRGSGGSDSGQQSKFPFGGGSGAGVSLQPTAFLVVSRGDVKLLPVVHGAIASRIIDVAPAILDRIQSMLARGQKTQTVVTVPQQPQ